MRVGEAEMFLQRSIFLSSSMAEHSAVNRVVVGSSPTWGVDMRLEAFTVSGRFFHIRFIFTAACCRPGNCKLTRGTLLCEINLG